MPGDAAGVQRVGRVGWSLVAVGVAGYGVGLSAAYPGRAFSVTAVMVGVTLVAVRAAFEGEAAT